jgi:YD repeat-containing protein
MRGRGRKLAAVSTCALAGLLASAGGCGSGEADDEHLGKQSQALDGAASDGGCREVTLQASRTPNGGGHDEDERELSPPMRIAIPSDIALSATTNSLAHRVELKFELTSGGEIECSYKGGAGSPNDRALLVACSGARRAGDILAAAEVALEIDDGTIATARVTLSEAAPCGSDGGVADASPPADAATSDAAVDSSPLCTPATCPSPSPCVVAQCTPAGCVTSPAAAGTACVVSACSVGDTCDGAGRCTAGTLLPVDDQNPCTIDGCDALLGVVHATASDGTACARDACTVAATCQAGVCALGTALDCSSGNPCVVDGCDAATGCMHLPRPAGDLACSNHDVCDGLELCSGTGVCLPGTPPTVDDGQVCTLDACDAVNGVSHTSIPGCDPTSTTGGETPFEMRASVLGRLVSGAAPVTTATFTVTDAPLTATSAAPASRADVLVQSAGDGSFRLRLTSFPDVDTEQTPPVHVVVRIEAPGLLPAFRDAWLRTGTAADLGTIRLIARDPAVTMIGPAGGTASDSQNLVQIIIPAGALAETIPVQITPLRAREEFPSPLPDSTVTMYGMVLEPSGVTFVAPAKVRIANVRGVSTSLVIPVGYFDEISGRWDHHATATFDGQRFAFETTHFSSFDGNSETGGGPGAGAGGGGPPNPPCASACCAAGGGGGGGLGGGGGPGGGNPNGGAGDGDNDVTCGSAATLGGGALRQSFRLPTYRVRDEEFGITLAYDSGLAGARRLGAAPSDQLAADHSSFAVAVRPLRVQALCLPAASTGTSTAQQPGLCSGAGSPAVPSCSLGQASPIPLSIEQSLAGSTATESFSMGSANAAAESGSYVNLPRVGTEVPSPGLYVARAVVRAQTPGACITSGGTFGVSDEQAPRVQTNLEPGPLGTFERHVLLNHRVSSPFGAGWTVREIEHVYRAGDVAVLARGDGGEESFHPRAYVRRLAGTATSPGLEVARDMQTGELLVARDDGVIASVDLATGAQTTVVTGAPITPSAPAEGLAVAYVSGQRRFVFWAGPTLFEVDGLGAARALATRGPSGATQHGSVAGRGDMVVFTDALTPVVRRVRLSDPARVVETLSLASGGDVRLFPRAALAGVTFAAPRGLAFGADGMLYLADVRRNELYALAPQLDGTVGPASRVDAVVGDGTSSVVAPLGERYPGVKLAMREPLGVSVGEDGTVFAFTTYGAAAYDPVAREAEWVALWASVDELTVNLTTPYANVVALTKSALVAPIGRSTLWRLDIDLLSSEFDATRTLSRLAGGGLELLDTTAAVVERFDVAGRIVERRRRTGELVMGFAYADARSDRLHHVTDPTGGQTVFSYDGTGKLQSVIDARGRVTQVAVNGFGDLASLTEPDGETHAFTYTEHRMTVKQTPKGDRTSYTFHTDGTMATATKPEGATTTLEATMVQPPSFDLAGAVARAGSYTDARGVVHAITTNRRGNIESDAYVADGVARLDKAVYAGMSDILDDDPNPNFVGPSLRRNAILRVSHRTLNDVPLGPRGIQWDTHFRPTRELSVRTNAQTHRWLYTPDGWLRSENVGSAGYSQIFDRDPAGHVVRVFDSLNLNVDGQSTEYTYRPDGQIATTTHRADARVFTKTFQYDDAGGTLNLLGWTDTLGRSTSYVLDDRGNAIQTSDGTATTFATFDANNRVIETRDALNNATTYGYTNAGCGCSQANLVTSIHTPDLPAGVDWQMTYDQDSRLASVTDPHGFTERYTYEPTGELKTVTDKLARQSAWSHDQLGRVLAMTDTLGRRHDQRYAVPAAGSWSGPTLMAGSGDATPSTTSLTGSLRSGDYQIGHNAYPIEGYPAGVALYQDATFQLTFRRSFDVNRRMTEHVDRIGEPIDSTNVSRFAATGNLLNRQDSWSALTARPVPVSISSGDGTAQFRVDSFFDGVREDGFWAGSEAQAVEDATRDADGRVTLLRRTLTGSAAFPRAVAVSTSTYTYRPDGRLSRLVNHDGTHDFTYDPRGLMETQTVTGEGTYTYGHDAMGRDALLTYPDGHTRTQSYDELGRLTSRCYEYSGPTTRCYTAQYDAVGNPTRMADPEGADTFEYDALDRLKKVTREVGGVVTAVEDYDYNALGALKVNAGVTLDHQRPRLVGAGTADAAVPRTAGGLPVVLDGAGSVTSLRGTSFTWSQRGFLREAHDPVPAALEHYGYDSQLRRFSKQQGVAAEFYVFEGLDRVATLDGAAAPTQQYLFDGIDHPLRIKVAATSATAYYELDLAGNVRGLRASGGASLGGYRYSAFGQTLEDTSPINQPLRWKARWYSPIAGGTYDVRARQWSPELGIFLAIDEYDFHDPNSTLWGWGMEKPLAPDPTGHNPVTSFLYCSWKEGRCRAKQFQKDEPTTCGDVPPKSPDDAYNTGVSTLDQGLKQCEWCYQECMKSDNRWSIGAGTWPSYWSCNN